MFTNPTYGPERSRRIRIVAWLLSVIVVAMLLAQLYTYEDFATSLSIVLPTNDQPLVKIIGAALIMFELLAIPYLLGMFLSPLMRTVSAISCILIILFWLLLALTTAHAPNVPLLGEVVTLHGGIIPFIWTLTMLACVSVVVQSDTTVK